MSPQTHVCITLLSALLLVACEGAHDTIESTATQFVVTGMLEDPAITEASGLARSSRDDRLWVINDGGSPAVLHAIGTDGSHHGSVRIQNARNIDWEDLAAFDDAGQSWLIAADIGDNFSRRKTCTLYFVMEPELPDQQQLTLTAQRTISFVYPDGPRDAESIAVDTRNDKILILSKRNLPAILYALPLHASSDTFVTAERLGEITSIPQPTQHDLERAVPDKNWHWRPVAMDISADGNTAVVLTYGAVYFYERQAGQSWLAALQEAPQRFDTGAYREAEAITIDNSGKHAYVTLEQRNAPLLRLDPEQ